MKRALQLDLVLAEAGSQRRQRLALFALLNLGLVESLGSRVLSPTDAIRLFYNAENCLHVRKQLRDKTAENIMSRGVQLADLFAALSGEEADREFLSELAVMRDLCHKLLQKRRSAA